MRLSADGDVEEDAILQAALLCGGSTAWVSLPLEDLTIGTRSLRAPYFS